MFVPDQFATICLALMPVVDILPSQSPVADPKGPLLSRCLNARESKLWPGHNCIFNLANFLTREWGKSVTERLTSFRISIGEQWSSRLTVSQRWWLVTVASQILFSFSSNWWLLPWLVDRHYDKPFGQLLISICSNELFDFHLLQRFSSACIVGLDSTAAGDSHLTVILPDSLVCIWNGVCLSRILVTTSVIWPIKLAVVSSGALNATRCRYHDKTDSNWCMEFIETGNIIGCGRVHIFLKHPLYQTLIRNIKTWADYNIRNKHAISHCFSTITRNGFCSHLRKIITQWPWRSPKNRDKHIEEFFCRFYLRQNHRYHKKICFYF